MNIAVLGATGWIGGEIVKEAASRGHNVISLVRDKSKVDGLSNVVRTLDIESKDFDLEQALTDVDTLVVSIGGRAANNHGIVAKSANRLLASLAETKTQRIVWVGGAGSLEVAPSTPLVTIPEFPEEYKPEAIAQGEALKVFRQYQGPTTWTYISPAAEIFPGDKQGNYRVGGEQLLTDEQGNSRISVTDYAHALVDELESAKHLNQRIGIAY
ncbi:NAD(P)-dependent oxidoreductase [Vibrio sp. SCSIO 43135]|uniref:NAD(P)-dependent oxidoreductase n=1 Tax=Vibrio sp. SCSIO 43135 TaxID=2819096 RepID=UPI00207655FC|nr:NAD(P)-dependent oxidoreductase [Vibrio sp. SCSIO 43135]USD42742.1 NAD(P)-dependent oxidoreductase [Vibrio sp. SCSIO 43135]